MEIPSFDDLMTAAPIAAMTLIVAAAGYYAAIRGKNETIKALRDWIADLIKQRNGK